MATEIKYKDLTIPVEAGQTVMLNTADKKLTGDIEVTAPKESGGGGSVGDKTVYVENTGYFYFGADIDSGGSPYAISIDPGSRVEISKIKDHIVFTSWCSFVQSKCSFEGCQYTFVDSKTCRVTPTSSERAYIELYNED